MHQINYFEDMKDWLVWLGQQHECLARPWSSCPGPSWQWDPPPCPHPWLQWSPSEPQWWHGIYVLCNYTNNLTIFNFTSYDNLELNHISSHLVDWHVPCAPAYWCQCRGSTLHAFHHCKHPGDRSGRDLGKLQQLEDWGGAGGYTQDSKSLDPAQ